MLGSPLLGTAVGLILLFATTALLCSGITESISTLFQMRARYLLTGMRAMLDAEDPDETDAAPVVSGTAQAARSETAPASVEPVAPNLPGVGAAGSLRGQVSDPGQTRGAATEVRHMTSDRPRDTTPSITVALFDSPLLRSLQSRRVFPLSRLTRNPQYVSARTFARALVDLLAPVEPGGPTGAQARLARIEAKVEELPPHLALRRQLLAMLDRADGELGAFELAVEQWYDEQMAKITGWYKRWARVVLGVVGLIVAVLFNIDTFQATRTLYVDAPVQQAVVASADAGALCQGTTGAQRTECVTKELTTLSAAGLPVGQPTGCEFYAPLAATCFPASARPVPLRDEILKLGGWAITAFAVSFGAPFWFEALSRLGSLRNAGTPPEPT
jgi:hypothetical protein